MKVETLVAKIEMSNGGNRMQQGHLQQKCWNLWTSLKKGKDSFRAPPARRRDVSKRSASVLKSKIANGLFKQPHIIHISTFRAHGFIACHLNPALDEPQITSEPAISAVDRWIACGWLMLMVPWCLPS